MNKRYHREALAVKRQDMDRHTSRGYVEPSQAELLAADKAYDAAKTDPAAWDRKIHRLHSEEVSMLRILGSAL